MILVTKPFLPPVEKYKAYIDQIYQRGWLTNNGPLINDFELKLKKQLGVKHLLVMNNGTIALQIALKALNIQGEVITTPFSYVATTSSIVWEGCTPVFVDINPDTFNINPALIEQAITPETKAILATHCFGNACDIDAIQKIADKHHLKVIYDGAHCFGTIYKGESIFNFGDITTCSLHATKLMHSVEGGFVVTKDPELLKKMAYMRNFGHNGPEDFAEVGINGKNSEFHAAMGLCVLESIEEIFKNRKTQCKFYDEILSKLQVRKITIQQNCNFNYAYYPIVFANEEQLLKAKAALEMKKIFPRRYFYPALSKLPYVSSHPVKVAEEISSRVLCLPLYFQLTPEEQNMIARVLLRVQNN